MNIIDKFIDFPNNYGEDRIFYNKNIAVVIDGSTPILKQKFKGYHSQAEWLAETLSINLNKSDDSINSICWNVIKDYINDTDILNLSNENKPCAVLAGIEDLNDNYLLSYIGVCIIVILYNDNKIEYYSDKRINYYSNLTKDTKQKAIKNNENIEDATKILRQAEDNLLYDNEEVKNKDDSSVILIEN